MVLIISQSRYEPSTEDVIDWLSYNKIPFHRINGIDIIKNIRIDISNKGLIVDLKNVDWSEVSVIWFRRWFSLQDIDEIFLKLKKDCQDTLAMQFNENLRTELRALTTFFFESLPKEKLFCRTKFEEINKLSVLKKASELGILIPDTSIITKRAEFEELRIKSPLITKAIDNVNSIQTAKGRFLGYTAKVNFFPKNCGESFAPSLFQSCVDKKFEIRAFLLNKRFYSMAIFSQADIQTEVDFRKYNNDDPNRVVPYKLPDDLEEKLLELATYFELRTGSFDLIKTNDGKYVFLEVNPGGQFGMVSYPCNYFLERQISYDLVK